jgi:hypothetical protein
MNRTIAVVMAALVAVLAAIGLLTGDSDESSGSSSSASSGSRPPIAAIARRVERIRGLRFERLPPVRRVTAAQAREEALRELDRQIPARELAGEQTLLKLLGLIPPDASLRTLLGKEFGSEVGGYYDPATGRLSVVGGASGLLGEITLAHELTHALEDQHFDLETSAGTGFNRDRSIADSTVREGTATVVMVDYVILRQTGQVDVPEALRRRVLSALDDAAVPSSSGLPRYLRESLVFPYPAGARLVDGVEQRGGWEAVNRLLEGAPPDGDAPVSSEQVMHPAKLRSGDAPVRVRVGGAAAGSSRGEKPLARGDFGEFDTEQLLRAANGEARSRPAAAGWGGGGFAIWRRPAGGYRLVVRWAWDTPTDADEFEAALRRTAADLATRDGNATRVSRGGDEVTLTLQSAP